MLITVVQAGMIGAPEILMIGGVFLLLFGGKKIPELMKGIGKGIREFNDAKEHLKENLEEGMRREEPKKSE